MSGHMIERVRDFLVTDCDALARFYEDVDLDERCFWSDLAYELTHMRPGLLEAQAGYLAQIVATAAERLETAGEA